MQNLSKEEMQRAIDYLSGVIFAMDGKIKQVSVGIYMILPEHIDINEKE